MILLRFLHYPVKILVMKHFEISKNISSETKAHVIPGLTTMHCAPHTFGAAIFRIRNV